MLQTYLNANILSLTDDGDFKKLKKSSDDIVKKIAKDKAKIVSYALSAIDPEVALDNADILEVKEIIVKNWSTFTSNTKDTPLTYIRAVILEAIQILVSNVNIAVLIWLATRNVIRYYKFTEQEKKVIFEYLSEIASKVNVAAINAWTISPTAAVENLKIDFKAFPAYLINDTSLQKYLEDASGPNTSAGAANFSSPNPYWPTNGEAWSHQFTPKAAKGIKTIVDLSLKAIANNIVENQKIIEAGLNDAIKMVIDGQGENGRYLQLRSELLWWKEACYSTSMDSSYREIAEGTIDLVMAYDLSVLIPTIYPKSADYFLKESYRSITEKSADKKEIIALLELVKEKYIQVKLTVLEPKSESAKITLLSYLIGLINNKFTLDQFESLLGIPRTAMISHGDFTLWLFHEFQLVKALNTK